MVKLYCFQKDDEIFPCLQVIYYQKKSVNEKLHIHYEIIRIVYFSNLELRYSINFKNAFFFRFSEGNVPEQILSHLIAKLLSEALYTIR